MTTMRMPSLSVRASSSFRTTSIDAPAFRARTRAYSRIPQSSARSAFNKVRGVRCNATPEDKNEGAKKPPASDLSLDGQSTPVEPAPAKSIPEFEQLGDADVPFEIGLGGAPMRQYSYEDTALVADTEKTAVQSFLFPDKEELPDDIEMSIWEHFEELRERIFLAAIVCGVAILTCFFFSKDLVVLLEEPVTREGVRFLQLSPGEYFFTTLKVAGYTGLLLAAPTVLYETAAFVIPGLTRSERQFLGPIVFGSSALFYTGLFFSYTILTPAALKFFVSYADGAVESLWSIDQYFEFVLVLMLSTGLSFQVPVVQLLLGGTGIVSSQQMLAVWRYVVVGAVVAAAVLTPSTDPFTQTLLAGPLIGLYMGGAVAVRALENSRPAEDMA